MKLFLFLINILLFSNLLYGAPEPVISIIHKCREDGASLSYSYDAKDYYIQWSVNGSTPISMQPGAGTINDAQVGEYNVYLYVRERGNINYTAYGPYIYNIYDITPSFTWSESNSCNGITSDAQITLSLNNNYPGVSYVANLLNAGGIEQSSVVTGGNHTFSGLNAGNYAVEVQANGKFCFYGRSIIIQDETLNGVTSTAITQNCQGLGGGIQTIIAGFQNNLTYMVEVENITNNQITTYQQTSANYTLPNVAPGTYNVTVSQGLCSSTQQVVVSEIEAQVSTSVYVNNDDNNCYWEFEANALGTTITNYTWELKDDLGNIILPDYNSPTNNIIRSEWNKNIASGKVIVTTSDGCTYEQVLTIPSTKLFPNDPPIITVIGKSCSSINPADGSIQVDLSNASSLFSISAVELAQNGSVVQTINTNGSNTVTFSGLEDDTYEINVLTIGMCPQDEIFPLEVIVPIADVPFTVTGVAKPYCTDGNVAQIALTVSPSGTYTYQWAQNGTSVPSGGMNPAILNTANHGTYNVTVSNGNCSVTEAFVTNGYNPVNIFPKDIVCGHGSAPTKVVAPINNEYGDPPYTVSIGQSSTNQWYVYPPPLLDDGNTLNVWVNAPGGSHDIRVVSSTGCSTIIPITINIAPLDIKIVAESPTSCVSNDGALTASVWAGGTAPFTYTWNNGQTGNQIDNLGFGTYTVTVTDAGGNCTGTATYTFDATTTVYSVDMDRQWNGPMCSSGTYGTIDVTFSNPAPPGPFSYQWSEAPFTNGAYTPFSTNGGTTAQITNVTEGFYQVQVTDHSNGCIYTSRHELNSSFFSILPEVEKVIDCQNGLVGFKLLNYDDYVDCPSINVEVKKERISDETVLNTSTYTMSGNGAQWWSLTEATDPDIRYKVVFTPCCNQYATTTEIYTYSDIYPEISAVAITPASCQTPGGVTITVGGGYAPYDVVWEDGFIGTTRSDLLAGDYDVTIIGNGGCYLTETITIPGLSGGPKLINPFSCGGQISIDDDNITNGLPSYNYSWTVDGGTILTSSAPVLFDQVGTYALSITDANGCVGTETVTINNEVFTVTENTSDVSCGTSNDGTISLSVVNNSSTIVSYDWTGPGNTTYVGHTLTGLSAGNYDYIVTDARGCTKEETVTISSVSNLNVSLGTPNCLPNISISGGTAPYEVYFDALNPNPLQTTFSINLPIGTNYPYDLYGLMQGNYFVTVIDANGCDVTSTLNTLPTNNTTDGFAIKMRWVRNEAPPVIGIVPSVDANIIKDDLMQQANLFLTDVDRLGGADYCKTIGDDKLSLGYDFDLHQYTLYYYNLKDELVRTVPPEGVDYIDGTSLDDLITWRANKTGITPTTPLPSQLLPNHSLVTTYNYNALGQMVSSETPDKGATNMFYTSDGLLRFAQDAKQLADNTYSYTLYDDLKRVIESGETVYSGTISQGDIDDLGLLVGTREEWVKTYYSAPHKVTGINVSYYNQANQDQRYLRNRVSYTENHQGVLATYSYDVHGNVEWVRQYTPGLGENYIAYDYDLITGNVNQVRYNEYSIDRFFHKYTYDEQNRLKEVYTSADGIIWDRDADYDFYAHGPLKRTELGDDRIQGLDYVYTIHGWIKAVNHPFMDQYEADPNVTTNDPSKDGFDNSPVMRDVFGYSLGYYANDYTRDLFLNPIDFSNATSLYNGNISAWSNGVNLQALDASTGGAFDGEPEILTQRNFTYDELNRIKTSKWLQVDGANAPNMSASTNTAYATSYTYDGNGNIQTLQRNGSAPVLIDDLSYFYGTGDLKNRLEYIIDTKGSQGVGDLDARQEYTYDEIGNIVSSIQKNNTGTITERLDVHWRVDGKVSKVEVSNLITGIDSEIEFIYDATGNRVAKVYDPNINNANDEIMTYHVRDASGNILATYQKAHNGTGFEIKLRERTLFGTARLGNNTPKSITFGTNPIDRTTISSANGLSIRLLKEKVFELSDHLGNVTMTLSDQKQAKTEGYAAQILTYQQYYPFGWEMPGRKYNTGDYRFGFNGKENDKEWGNQLIQDYGFRLYNPAIAKFLSFDPLAPEYPELTPYQFASNSPIEGIDLDGLEFLSTHYMDIGGGGSSKVEKTNSSRINLAVWELTSIAVRKSNVDGRPESIFRDGFMRGNNNSISPAVHATNLYGEASNSKWLSTSKCIVCIGKYKGKWTMRIGSIFHTGKPYFINIGQAKKTGTTYVGPKSLMNSVNDFSNGKTPSEIGRINTWKSRQGFFGGEREALFLESIDPSAIESKTTIGLRMFGKGLMAYGIYNTGTALHGAYEEGGGVNSIPFKNESIRQASSWGTSFAGAWAFMKIGATVGSSGGSFTGPGAVITGIVGGLAGGAFGYWFGDKYFTEKDQTTSKPQDTE